MFYITDDKMQARFLADCTEEQFREFARDGYAICSEENGDLKITQTADWLLEKEIPYVADIRVSIPADDLTSFVLFCGEPGYDVLWYDFMASFNQGSIDVIVVPSDTRESSSIFLAESVSRTMEAVMAANEAAREDV